MIRTPGRLDAHESRCVQALFEFMLPREMPPRVIGDRA
jgi:hypothetical protein